MMMVMMMVMMKARRLGGQVSYFTFARVMEARGLQGKAKGTMMYTVEEISITNNGSDIFAMFRSSLPQPHPPIILPWIEDLKAASFRLVKMKREPSRPPKMPKMILGMTPRMLRSNWNCVWKRMYFSILSCPKLPV